MIIYQITNKVNNDFYIGKTIQKLTERFSGHKYACGTGSETYLHRAMRKYGIDNFLIEVLCNVESTEELDNKEKHFIQTLKPSYNMTKGGEGGDTSDSPKFKESMKQYHSKKSYESYATYGMSGKKQSEKFLQSIKKSNSCPVMCEGVEYSSVGEAQLAYKGISIRKRIDNPKYPDFYRLKEKTKRK